MLTGDAKMEKETTLNSLDSANPQAKHWLTLEQLLGVLPLKKSYVYYLTHTGQIPVTRVGRRLLFDYDRIVEWLEERTILNDSSLSDQKGKRTLVR